MNSSALVFELVCGIWLIDVFELWIGEEIGVLEVLGV